MYQTLVLEFTGNPRDVHTVPTYGVPMWFYVFGEDGGLYVEAGRSHSPKCTVRRRRLLEAETAHMLELYHRRQRGEAVSREASAFTQSQVYWYGIFAEMKW